MTSRILEISSTPLSDSTCVVYVMSRDQRVYDNHALLEAQKEAIENKLPLIVQFVLLPHSGVRAREHYQFMVDGLKQVENELGTLNIPFVISIGDMKSEVSLLVSLLKPRSVYFDFSPLRGPRRAIKAIAKSIKSRVLVVDTHNIVPTWVLSDKQEFAAHTIRRKLHKQIEPWLTEPATPQEHPFSLSSTPGSKSWADVKKILGSIDECGITCDFESGETAAKAALERFIKDGLVDYASERNKPSVDGQSDLSPYLHYGQLSSLRILLDILRSSDAPPQLLREPKMPSAGNPPSKQDGIDAFVEELVVRKELSDNYCFYNSDYTSLAGAPEWAQKSLNMHRSDPRDFTYAQEQFENAKTHDDIWNAAQLQLRKSGKIHGYMRMYWAKKILEWSDTPEQAIETAIYLNDHYSIDGGDPNGYVGILWSIAGLHDRPWFERSVYGTVRYMADSGLKKKFDTATYVSQWQ